METVKITKEAFVFDKTEKEKLLTALGYLKHRLRNHDSVGIMKLRQFGITTEFVDYLMFELNKGSCHESLVNRTARDDFKCCD